MASSCWDDTACYAPRLLVGACLGVLLILMTARSLRQTSERNGLDSSRQFLARVLAPTLKMVFVGLVGWLLPLFGMYGGFSDAVADLLRANLNVAIAFGATATWSELFRLVKAGDAEQVLGRRFPALSGLEKLFLFCPVVCLWVSSNLGWLVQLLLNVAWPTGAVTLVFTACYVGVLLGGWILTWEITKRVRKIRGRRETLHSAWLLDLWARIQFCIIVGSIMAVVWIVLQLFVFLPQSEGLSEAAAPYLTPARTWDSSRSAGLNGVSDMVCCVIQCESALLLAWVYVFRDPPLGSPVSEK